MILGGVRKFFSKVKNKVIGGMRHKDDKEIREIAFEE